MATVSDPLRAAIERHRDDPPPRLELSLPVDRLMDGTYCQTLIGDLGKLAGGGWELLKATKTAWQMIPNSPGLYMFIWQPPFELPIADRSSPLDFPTILYVGSSGDGASNNTLKKRYKGDYAKFVGGDPEELWSTSPTITRDARLRRYLALAPLHFLFTVINEPSEIYRLEKRLFNLFSPPLNSTGGPRLRPAGGRVRGF